MRCHLCLFTIHIVRMQALIAIAANDFAAQNADAENNMDKDNVANMIATFCCAKSTAFSTLGLAKLAHKYKMDNLDFDKLRIAVICAADATARDSKLARADIRVAALQRFRYVCKMVAKLKERKHRKKVKI